MGNCCAESKDSGPNAEAVRKNAKAAGGLLNVHGDLQNDGFVHLNHTSSTAVHGQKSLTPEPQCVDPGEVKPPVEEEASGKNVKMEKSKEPKPVAEQAKSLDEEPIPSDDKPQPANEEPKKKEEPACEEPPSAADQQEEQEPLEEEPKPPSAEDEQQEEPMSLDEDQKTVDEEPEPPAGQAMEDNAPKELAEEGGAEEPNDGALGQAGAEDEAEEKPTNLAAAVVMPLKTQVQADPTPTQEENPKVDQAADDAENKQSATVKEE